ncbi:MAG: O-acetyl-ADP-ribose deacetylase [Chitinophagales bacterium]
MSDYKRKIEILHEDITRVCVDAIVNAANSSLMGGGGVDAAIHRAGGPFILKECKRIVARQGACPTGEAVITTAGYLPAKYVIHTVGPVWHGGKNYEKEKLANCYKNALKLANQHACRSIAFPNISTGIYGFPKKDAAAISVHTVLDDLDLYIQFEKVLFICFDLENYDFLRQQLEMVS